MFIDVRPDVPYKAEFFDGLTNQFLERLRESEESALQFFRDIMRTNLRRAYNKMGFRKGDVYDFARVAGERDKSVGLRVSFDVSPNRIIYRFHTDPFPKLKGKVDPDKLDATYMDFKVSYLLGFEWRYVTTFHIWNEDPFTEHVITKRETCSPIEEHAEEHALVGV